MSNYRRLISYIYAYEGGIKGKNIGFAKIEARSSQCKITVNVKKVYMGGNDIGVYLLSGEREILLGNIFVRGGSGEFRTVVSVNDVEHSGISMDQCYGLTVHDVENTWRSYTTIWEDAVAHAAELELSGTLPEKEEAKRTAREEQIKKAVKEIEEEFPLKADASGSSVTEGDGEAESRGAQIITENVSAEAAEGVGVPEESVTGSPQGDGNATGHYRAGGAAVSERPRTDREAVSEPARALGSSAAAVREQMRVLAENAREQSRAIVEMIRKQTEPFLESADSGKAVREDIKGQTAGAFMSPPNSTDPMGMLWKEGSAAGIPDYGQAGYGYYNMPAVEFASEFMPDPGSAASQVAWNLPCLSGYSQEPGLNCSEANASRGYEADVYGNDTEADPSVNAGYGFSSFRDQAEEEEEKRIFGSTAQEYGEAESGRANGEMDSWTVQGIEGIRGVRGTRGVQEVYGMQGAQGEQEIQDLQENLQEAQGRMEELRLLKEAQEAQEPREMQEPQVLQEAQEAQEAQRAQEPREARATQQSQSPSQAPVIQQNQSAYGSRPEPGNPNELNNLPETEENEAVGEEQLWESLKRGHMKIMDFDYEKGCEILTIKPQDIGLLPREVWVFGNNSFLLHGYYNFRYLILAKLCNPEGAPRYLLGVPGHYYSNEKYMAAMFGFPEFVLSKNQPMEDGRFGYWYTDIHIVS